VATSKDEHDVAESTLTAGVQQTVIPTLSEIASEINVELAANITVVVRDKLIPKFAIQGNEITRQDIDENAEVRLRFRYTHRDDRILFKMETQHTDMWRETGFSGVRISGDILLGKGEAECRIRGKTICYNQGWSSHW